EALRVRPADRPAARGAGRDPPGVRRPQAAGVGVRGGGVAKGRGGSPIGIPAKAGTRGGVFGGSWGDGDAQVAILSEAKGPWSAHPRNDQAPLVRSAPRDERRIRESSSNRRQPQRPARARETVRSTPAAPVSTMRVV